MLKTSRSSMSLLRRGKRLESRGAVLHHTLGSSPDHRVSPATPWGSLPRYIQFASRISAPVPVAHTYLDDEKIAAAEIDVCSFQILLSMTTLTAIIESHSRMPRPLQTSLHLRPSRHGAQTHPTIRPRRAFAPFSSRDHRGRQHRKVDSRSSNLGHQLFNHARSACRLARDPIRSQTPWSGISQRSSGSRLSVHLWGNPSSTKVKTTCTGRTVGSSLILGSSRLSRRPAILFFTSDRSRRI